MAGAATSPTSRLRGEARGDDRPDQPIQRGCGADGLLEQLVAQRGDAGGHHGGHREDGVGAEVGLPRQHHDHQPVPEVGPVGDLPEVHERGPAEQPLGHTTAGALEAGDQGHGQGGHDRPPDDGVHRDERRRRPHQATDEGQRDPGEGRGHPAGPQPGDQARGQGQRGPGEQLVGPGVGAVVGPIEVAVGQQQGGGERRQPAGDHDGAEDRGAVRTQPPHQGEEAAQQQRPHQVELLLHRERPVVGHRADLDVGREVVGRLRDELPVGHVEGGGPDPPLGLGQLDGCGDGREHDRGHHQVHRRRREQPPGPAGVEAPEAHGAVGPVQVPEQEAGHQVPRQHEEHVDADEAAVEPGQPGVERDDEVHRDRPHPIQVGAMVPPAQARHWARTLRQDVRGGTATTTRGGGAPDGTNLRRPAHRSGRKGGRWPRTQHRPPPRRTPTRPPGGSRASRSTPGAGCSPSASRPGCSVPTWPPPPRSSCSGWGPTTGSCATTGCSSSSATGSPTSSSPTAGPTGSPCPASSTSCCGRSSASAATCRTRPAWSPTTSRWW